MLPMPSRLVHVRIDRLSFYVQSVRRQYARTYVRFGNGVGHWYAADRVAVVPMARH